MFGGEPRAEVVLLRGDAELASWPLLCPGRPDLSVVDELARMQLAARRLGCSIWLRDACVELSALLELAGLADVVMTRPERPSERTIGPERPPERTIGPERRLEVGGEAEGGEQGGVEEVVVPDDLVP